ncbi:MAG: proton-conducting transporter transmembrane domain-containing protein [Planctomycetota bacterium]
MNEISLITYLAHYFILFPIAKVLFVNIQCFARVQEREENLVRKLVNWGGASDFIHILIAMIFLGFNSTPVRIESFCLVGWPLTVNWDLHTFIFLVFTTTIIAVIGRFSLFYLHRDAYYHKFFSLYFIFQLALALIILSSSTTYLFMGWELLGLSSVLLIAFYEHRSSPLKNGLRVLFIYEFGDIFFFSLILLMLFFHIEDITKLSLIQEHGCEWAMLLLLVACFFKSGIFPWIYLPRAMEGPTPSSAIFYGSLSSHIPIFLLLHVWPQEWTLPAYWPEVWTIVHPAYAIVLAIAICIFSAFVTTLMSRQHSDAKNTIAYATTTQLAIIYIEIFFGLYTLALVHVVSHGIYRTFEILRTPSLFHLYHTMETRRPRMTSTGNHFKSILPARLRNWLYSLTINEFGFLPRSFDLIDQFLCLKFQRFDKKSAGQFSITLASVWVIFSVILFIINRNHFDVKDELLMALAVGFSILSFCNIRNISMFFVTLACSACTVGLIQAEQLIKHVESINLGYWVFVIVLAIDFVVIAFYSVYALSHGNEKHTSYTAKRSRSPLANALLFVFGLTIVGVPGLGTFVGWEYLVHHTVTIAPYVVLKGFFILKVNTVLVFLFYFSNFLGSPEHKVQMLHHYKHDTLHLRWVQKHAVTATQDAENREAPHIDDSRGNEK